MRAKEPRRVDWEEMDVPEKIRYIMWRFVMHPDYLDWCHWTARLDWNMGPGQWQFSIVRDASSWRRWNGTVNEVLKNALEEIEKEIKEADSESEH